MIGLWLLLVSTFGQRSPCTRDLEIGLYEDISDKSKCAIIRTTWHELDTNNNGRLSFDERRDLIFDSFMFLAQKFVASPGSEFITKQSFIENLKVLRTADITDVDDADIREGICSYERATENLQGEDAWDALFGDVESGVTSMDATQGILSGSWRVMEDGTAVELPGVRNKGCKGSSCQGNVEFSFVCTEKASPRWRLVAKTPDSKADSVKLNVVGKGRDKTWNLGRREDFAETFHSSTWKDLQPGTYKLLVKGREDGLQIRSIQFDSDADKCGFVAPITRERLANALLEQTDKENWSFDDYVRFFTSQDVLEIEDAFRDPGTTNALVQVDRMTSQTNHDYCLQNYNRRRGFFLIVASIIAATTVSSVVGAAISCAEGCTTKGFFKNVGIGIAAGLLTEGMFAGLGAAYKTYQAIKFTMMIARTNGVGRRTMLGLPQSNVRRLLENDERSWTVFQCSRTCPH